MLLMSVLRPSACGIRTRRGYSLATICVAGRDVGQDLATIETNPVEGRVGVGVTANINTLTEGMASEQLTSNSKPA